MKKFLGKRIVEIRKQTSEEMSACYWTTPSMVLVLDDGSTIFVASDYESNSSGVMLCSKRADNKVYLVKEAK